MSVTINREQALYVIPCGQGFTCLGFDVAFEKVKALHAELSPMLSKPLPELPKRKGTMKVYNMLTKLQSIAAEIYKKHRVQMTCELTPQLKGLEGRRVEVVDCYGDKRRFYVSRSTGWIPCHLEVARSNSSSGMAVTGAPFKSVTVIR